METHKPKTWHGPGEFLREYVIIVVGVATALAGEQTIEWLHHQSELAETREALRDEIAENGSLMLLGAALDSCRLAMIGKYEDWARGAPKPEKQPSVGIPKLSFNVWDVAKAGPLSRMPVEERLSYSLVFDYFAVQQKGVDRQIDLALELARYTNQQELNLDHDQAQRLLETSSAARAIISTKERSRPTLFNDLQTLGVSPGPVSESNRERLTDLCTAAGVPVPALPSPEPLPSNVQKLTKTN